MSEAKRIGILGAGGYVGGRLMQLAALERGLEATALIRGFRSLGKLSASPVAYRLTDTSDAVKMAEAIRGLDAVVNMTLGDIAQITDDTRIMVEACRLAGVRRFIHLSSAVVYGRVESPDLAEDAPAETDSWMLYAREKARAEEYLREEMKKSGLEIVVLRPGLIWGPGSGWARMIGGDLSGGLTLPGNGRGIINLVYVDNLVRLIFRAAAAPEAGSGFHNARDAETMTWREFALAAAAALDLPADRVRTVPGEALPFSPKRVLEWALQQRSLYRLMRKTLATLSPEAKQALKRRVHHLTGAGPVPPAEYRAPSGPPAMPKLTREHWTLQTTRHALPAASFTAAFGAVDLLPFPEALRRTAVWLKFVTTPVTPVSAPPVIPLS